MNIVRRRYRLVGDVTARIDPIDPAAALESWRHQILHWARDMAVSPAAYVSHQQRFLEAILGDPVLLDAWLRHEAACEIAVAADLPHDIEFLEDDVLPPLIERLDPAARGYLLSILGTPAFNDFLEALWSCVGSRFVSLKVEPGVGGPRPVGAVGLARKPYRVSVTVAIHFSEVRPRTARRSWLRAMRKGLVVPRSPAEYARILNALLHEIAASPVVLDRWCQREVGRRQEDATMEFESWPREDEVLAPLAERLSGDARVYFERLLRDQYLADAAAEFLNCPASEVDQLTIEPVRRGAIA